MAFCPKCGKEVADDAVFCAGCGANLAGGAQNAQQGESVQEKAKELLNTPDTTNQFDPTDINDNKVLAVLSYIGILVLVPLIAAPNSRYARFHANQGLTLWITSLILSAVTVIPILGWIIGVVGNIIAFVLMIIGIVNAVQGRAKQLPIIGKFTILK